MKRSPFKKTYYFANTHDALVENISLPLDPAISTLVVINRPISPRLVPSPPSACSPMRWAISLHREGRVSRRLNAADRWASVILQEISADVFGILIVAEVASRQGWDCRGMT